MARVKKPFSPKLTGIILVIVATIFTVIGVRSKAKAEEFRDKGVDTPGKVERAAVRNGSKNKKNYYLSVAYQIEGHPLQREFKVRSAFFKSHVDGNDRVKVSDVTVRYLPDRHESAIINGGEIDYSGMIWLGGFMMILGVGLVFYGFVRRPVPSISVS